MTRVVNIHRESCDINIMRGTIYGNPYRIGPDGTQEEVVEKFRKYFEKRIHDDVVFLQAVGELKGKKIGCCHDSKPCHGDVYVEFCDENLVDEYLEGILNR